MEGRVLVRFLVQDIARTHGSTIEGELLCHIVISSSRIQCKSLVDRNLISILETPRREAWATVVDLVVTEV